MSARRGGGGERAARMCQACPCGVAHLLLLVRVLLLDHRREGRALGVPQYAARLASGLEQAGEARPRRVQQRCAARRIASSKSTMSTAMAVTLLFALLTTWRFARPFNQSQPFGGAKTQGFASGGFLLGGPNWPRAVCPRSLGKVGKSATPGNPIFLIYPLTQILFGLKKPGFVFGIF